MATKLEELIMGKTKEAMLAKDAITRDTLRNISSEFKQKRIDDMLESLTEEQELAVLKKMVKQRKDSINQYQVANRPELVEKEQKELGVIEQFLPQQLSVEEIGKEVEIAIVKVGATSAKEMGKVIGALSHLKAVADMGEVSKIVKEKLI